MKIEIDNEKYSELAGSFLQWLEKWIEYSVKNETDLDEEEREDLVGTLKSSLASFLDGSGNCEHEGNPLVPILGFLDPSKGEDDTTLIMDDGTIALHEMIDDEDEEWE